VSEYLVKCWVKVNAEDKWKAQGMVIDLLDLDYLSKRITDYKVLDTIEADKVTTEWER